MSQSGIKNFLKKHTPRKYESKDLSKYLEINFSAVCQNLRKIREDIRKGKEKHIKYTSKIPENFSAGKSVKILYWWEQSK